MKRLIIYSIISLIFISNTLGQSRVSGYVYDEFTNDAVENVAIFDNYSNKIFYSDKMGYFNFIKGKTLLSLRFI